MFSERKVRVRREGNDMNEERDLLKKGLAVVMRERVRGEMHNRLHEETVISCTRIIPMSARYASLNDQHSIRFMTKSPDVSGLVSTSLWNVSQYCVRPRHRYSSSHRPHWPLQSRQNQNVTVSMLLFEENGE